MTRNAFYILIFNSITSFESKKVFLRSKSALTPV